MASPAFYRLLSLILLLLLASPIYGLNVTSATYQVRPPTSFDFGALYSTSIATFCSIDVLQMIYLHVYSLFGALIAFGAASHRLGSTISAARTKRLLFWASLPLSCVLPFPITINRSFALID